jgi:hypothetical protein
MPATTAPDDASFQRLDAGKVLGTLDGLSDRMTVRFPERNISRVAASLRLLLVSGSVPDERERRRDRVIALLCALGAVTVVGVAIAALGLSFRDAVPEAPRTPAFQWLQVIDSAINDTVFAGIAVYFLWSIPARRRRARTLGRLHRLRSLAHVIDMHQLTKDPERLRADYPATERSPSPGLTANELGRYLDYCSELLSLVAKTAALSAQTSTDAVVLDTVSEIESLTLGISRKIWQKIALLPRDGDGRGRG